MNRQPKWQVSVTHIPSGTTVIRDSNHYRSQHTAKEAAIRYLKSKIAYAYKQPDTQDFKYTYTVPDDNMYPRDLKDYREDDSERQWHKTHD